MRLYRGAGPGPGPHRRAGRRARCSMLLTATVVTPTSSATSAARQPSTSRSRSTARWRAGRYCSTRNQGQPRVRPGRHDRGRIGGLAARQPRIRERLQPRDLSDSAGNGSVRIARRRAQAGRERPPRAGLQRSQARVGRNPVQPGPQRRPALERAEGPPRPQQRLLDDVLGVVHRAEHAVAVGEQLGPQRLRQPRELRVPQLLGDRGGHMASPGGSSRRACAHRHRTDPGRGQNSSVATRNSSVAAAAARGEFGPRPGSVLVSAGPTRFRAAGEGAAMSLPDTTPVSRLSGTSAVVTGASRGFGRGHRRRPGPGRRDRRRDSPKRQPARGATRAARTPFRAGRGPTRRIRCSPRKAAGPVPACDPGPQCRCEPADAAAAPAHVGVVQPQLGGRRPAGVPLEPRGSAGTSTSGSVVVAFSQRCGPVRLAAERWLRGGQGHHPVHGRLRRGRSRSGTALASGSPRCCRT